MGAEKKIAKQKPLPSKPGTTSSKNIKIKLRPRKTSFPTKQKTSDRRKADDLGLTNEAESIFSDTSLIRYLNHIAKGHPFNSSVRRFQKVCIVNNIIKNFSFTTLSPFERRVTSIAWHPKYSQFVVIGSKGGELALYSMNKPGGTYLPGIGAGGSVVGLKFSLDDPAVVYTASITGDIREENFDRRGGTTLISTGSLDDWFSSLDISYHRKILLFGDNSGNVYLLNDKGEKVWPSRHKLHKGKVTHVEFSLRDPNLFATASVDHSAKLWDLRMMMKKEQRNIPLHEFQHNKGVNSAYFSSSNGSSLLTTDQHSDIRVYKSPNWEEKIVIKHPHRQFQHITPIKASWHPIEDIIVVGRYPDNNVFKNDERTIDFYDGSTGKLLHGMKSPTGGIISLNSFNINGDSLVSGAGCNVVFMKDKNVFDGIKFRVAPVKLVLSEE